MKLIKRNKKPKLLISFQSTEEISDVEIEFVDILDLKDPVKGSLGAWKIKYIKNVIKNFGKITKISATLGDLKDCDLIVKKINSFDKLGLDFIKFGIFENNENKIEKIFKIIFQCNLQTTLVPVIFVDFPKIKEWAFNNLDRFLSFGFKYILLDTFKKNSKNLLEICNENLLNNFILESTKLGIKVGLAGKLELKHLNILSKLNPRIIGFRSGVCENNNRIGKVSNNKVKEISSLIH